MSDSKEKREISYFIDEAGDTTLFDKRGKKLLVGNGASKFFILGKILVAEPYKLRKDLRKIRAELLADPYFRDVPSMQPESLNSGELLNQKAGLQLRPGYETWRNSPSQSIELLGMSMRLVLGCLTIQRWLV